MNIAIATPEFVSEKIFDGGLANYTYKLAKWLLAQGHVVKVYIPSGPSNDPDHFMYEDIEVERVKIKDYSWLIRYQLNRVGLGFLISDKLKYNIQFRQYALALKKRILSDHKQKSIDIIHYPHLAGYAFYRPKKIPSVVRLSSSTMLCQQMGGYGSSNLQIEVQARFEAAAMKKADVVFGPSRMIAGITEPQIGKTIQIIETPYVKPEGALDESVYRQLLAGKCYVLFFGTISLIKGVGTISKIIYPLLKENPGLHYVFVGKQQNNQVDRKTLWDKLVENAAEYADRVIYIPSLRHPALFPVIQNATLVTLPSRTDNFPNTCIEAMANKKIVIGTKGNGFDQLIDHGKNGFVIDVDDHCDLLTKINEVLAMDPIRRQQMENAAAQRTEALHPDVVLGQLVELYKHIIEENN